MAHDPRPPGASTSAPHELAGMIRNLDWAATSVGSPERWDQSLRTVVSIMLSSRYAMWMGWGDDLSFFYNDAYAPTLGLKHPRALGRPASEVWAEIWPDIGPRIESVLATGEATWDEGLLLFLERAGFREETYHTFSYSPLADDAGATAGMLCVVTEETERVIGERRLASLRELAAGLAGARSEDETLDAVAAGLASASRDLPFALVYLGVGDAPARLARRIGISADHPAATSELVGDRGWPLPEGWERAIAIIDDAGAFFDQALPSGPWTAPPMQAAVVPIASAGQTEMLGCVIVGLNPHRRFDDAFSGFLGLIRGQIAAALASARIFEGERRRAAALAEIDRAKTAFFSNVSHEFRTPLTLMMSPLEDVLAARPSEPIERFLPVLDIAHRNSKRLLRLVNTLLDFSRIEAGRAQAQFAPTDLAALTIDLASNFRAACEKAGLALVIDCAALPGPVHVDRQMWEKIVLNLLSNAFKFTFEGSISVSLRSVGPLAELTVRDTGVGIPDAERARIFERFHRVAGQKGRTHEGSGIGLALVRELAAQHGGDVAVESVVGRGSVFTVRLPLGSAHLASEQVVGQEVADTASAFIDEAFGWLPGPGSPERDDRGDAAPDAMPGRDAGPRPRILVADDNADMRDYIRRLMPDDWDVAGFGDGDAALQEARRRRPDLIVSDVMMPRLDGFGLLATLRADPELKTVPVILLSARAGEEAQVEGLRAGADDYMVKPFSARELVARVRANLEMARLRRESEAAIAEKSVELETVLSTIPTPVWFTRDSLGEQMFQNRAAASLLGLGDAASPSVVPQGDERLSGITVFRDGVAAPRDSLPLYRALRGEEVRDDEQELRFGDGRKRILLTQAQPLRNAAGAAIGAVCAATDITERKRAEEAVLGQKRILEMVARGAPLAETLDALMALIEWLRPGVVCGIMQVSEDGTRFERGRGATLPAAYHDALVDAALARPYLGPCGQAADLNAVVVVSDIAADVEFTPEWRELALSCGFQSLRSTPVRGLDGRVLAAFAMYYPQTGDADTPDSPSIDAATHLASIAIERDKAERSLRQANQRLRIENTEVARINISLSSERNRLMALFEQAPGFMSLLAGPGHVVEFANAAYRRLVGERDIVGRPVREVFPEVEGQGYFEMLDDAYRSGEAVRGEAQSLWLRRSAQGPLEQRFVDFVYQPVTDEAGRVSGIFVEGVDVTERVAAAAALAESEAIHRALAAQQEAVLSQLAEGVIVTDAEGRITFVNDAAARLHGVTELDVEPEDYSAAYHLFTEDGSPYPSQELPLARAAKRGEVVADARWRIRRGDGSEILAAGGARPVYASDGARIGAVLTLRDETRREAAAMALRESDLRQNLALSAGRMGVWDWNVTSGALTWSASQYALYGVDQDAFVPTYDSFMAMVHPADRARLAANAQAILVEGGPYAGEFRILCPDGSERWLATRSDVVRDDAGRPIRMVGVNFDITDRKKAEAARLLMINELNHRVKNTLATVQSMAAQSFRDVADPQRAREAFTARLLALSRAHDVLTRESWVAAGLRDVVEQALAPFQAPGRKRFSMFGPDVRLSSKEALAISMSLHELATNAAKYGSLSGNSGEVALDWAVTGRFLRMSWTESGGPPVRPPTRSGFGSRLVERGLAQELDGAVELDFRPQGLVCRIEAPLQLMTSSISQGEEHDHVGAHL